MENNENNIISNEVKKEKNNKGVIALLVIIIIAMAGYIVYDKVIKDNIKEDKNQEEVNDSEELDINSDLVSKLKMYIPKEYIPSDENEIYSDKMIKVTDLSNQFILYQGLRNEFLKNDEVYISESNTKDFTSCDFVYSELGTQLCYKKKNDNSNNILYPAYGKDVVERNVKTIFGDNVNYNNQKSTYFDYYDKYYIVKPSGFSKFTSAKSTKIYNAIQKNDEIYLYEKYVFVDFDNLSKDYKSVDVVVYKDRNKINKIDKLTIDNADDFDDISFINNAVNKYEKDSAQYKHTFKKNNDGEYYWYSTELVK